MTASRSTRAKEHFYLKLSTHGGHDDDRLRWEVELDIPLQLRWRLWKCQAIDEDIGLVTGHAPRKRGVEDWAWAESPVCSQRMREVVDTLCPGMVQYLPLQVLYRKEVMFPAGTYWVMNLLDSVDCIDEPTSESFIAGDFPGANKVYMKVCIDVDRIPPDKHLFRLHGCGVKIVTSKVLREALQAAGVTGVNYFSFDNYVAKSQHHPRL